MREPNLCFPSQSRAAVCITSALYDRRALDCTATLPLVNSLTHLAYLTSTSPRIREILCLDGGLEKLVRILSQTSSRSDRLTLWKWTLAFQSIVNVGVRGTEQIRTKVVDTGVIPFVLTILGNFTKSYEIINGKKEMKRDPISSPSTSTGILSKGLLDTTPLSSTSTSSSSTASQQQSSPASNASIAKLPSVTPAKSALRRSTFPYVKVDPAQRRYRRIHKERQDPKFPELENVFHREEDVLLCLQLLAYLSKYPHIRDLFNTAYNKNVFSVVEKFCHRIHPGPIQYWAGVIMRNACRKDETRGGIRRCANMSCGKWESQPREFAKCRRCRKAKYCSKACQSKAWADGHRWWCVERHSSIVRDSNATAAIPTVTAATPATNATTITAATTTTTTATSHTRSNTSPSMTTNMTSATSSVAASSSSITASTANTAQTADGLNASVTAASTATASPAATSTFTTTRVFHHPGGQNHHTFDVVIGLARNNTRHQRQPSQQGQILPQAAQRQEQQQEPSTENVLPSHSSFRHRNSSSGISNMTLIEQGTDNAEGSETTTMLMDMGVHMEL
ncbi:Protein phosphatase PP2A regulatory subunit B [Mucor velutinosus]|uniref:Protein phosphatase PP2A regulatory subunit B n=1 Tax=Mucor velutinosus TaxID=708070 RepID=A0AAN7DQW8_9FUNG|nr:Protein phosphatase PP2A regulatory subunit B [Mucor velutinosus]